MATHKQQTTHPLTSHPPPEAPITPLIVNYCTWQKFLPGIAMKVQFKSTAPSPRPPLWIDISCSLIERVHIPTILTL